MGMDSDNLSPICGEECKELGSVADKSGTFHPVTGIPWEEY